MTYAVKETFYSLQGEGRHTGRPAVFCRFAGCNLWTGREKDRADAVCTFCDTEFVGTDGVGGGKFRTAEDLAGHVASYWESRDPAFVVFTGGEPLLQLDAAVIEALHAEGFEVAVETNGTLVPPIGVDWVCVSPKPAPLILKEGDELKLVYPQEAVQPEDVDSLKFRHFYLQPMDGPDIEQNTRLAVSYCLSHPRWKLSLQTQKSLGLR